MLCNIADRPEACNFILPAIVRRGDLVIAVSTSGASPAYAKHLRRLRGSSAREHGRFLVLMRAIRKRLLAEHHAPEAHKPLFERLISESTSWTRSAAEPTRDMNRRPAGSGAWPRLAIRSLPERASPSRAKRIRLREPMEPLILLTFCLYLLSTAGYVAYLLLQKNALYRAGSG